MERYQTVCRKWKGNYPEFKQQIYILFEMIFQYMKVGEIPMGRHMKREKIHYQFSTGTFFKKSRNEKEALTEGIQGKNTQKDK